MATEWKDDPDIEALPDDEDAEDKVNYDPDTGRWLGKALDDGTGRNVYYVNVDGTRSRRMPRGYVPELLENGERRYYFRKTCIRCRRTDIAPICLTMGNGEVAFSLNLCDSCHIKTVPGTTRLRGNASAFYKANAETPKSLWINLSPLALSETRGTELRERAREARVATLKDAKLLRNKQRFMETRRIAREYGIDDGEHISWGYGEVFDEYYGALHPETHFPHGEGYKEYSDGSIYYGGFSAGERHSEMRGVWTRPSGSIYDGQWQFDQRHGRGTQIYPDGTRYEGEFAKGFEHGQGRRTYPDGSSFEGRFRFGRRDGPGTLIDKDGNVEKATFAPDPKEKFSEKEPPIIAEADNPAEDYFQPDSLLHLTLVALAQTMHSHREKFASAKRLTARVPEHLKAVVAAEFLRCMSPQGTKSFLENGPRFAFTLLEEVVFRNVRITQADCQALMYFQGSNSRLRTLVCCGNGLDLPSLDVICKTLGSGAWPALHSLDLSFNAFDISTIEQLIAGAGKSKTTRALRLASCDIKSNGFLLLSNWLATNPSITSLDLAFNTSDAFGAQLLAEALTTSNHTLTSLNIRSNRIGTLGGMALCETLKINKTIKVLCVADNGCGPELLALISGRLGGTLRNVVTGVVIDELNMPYRYKEGRYTANRRLPDEYKALAAEE